MQHPNFGRTTQRTDYDDSTSTVKETVFRHGKPVHSTEWQEEMIKVLDKSQAAAVVIAALETLSAGECSALSIDIQTDEQTGQPSKIIRKWRIG